MKSRISVLFVLLLALSLILAGCGQQITAEEIVARMQETVENTQDAHAVVSASLDAQGITMSGTAEVWEKSPNKVRARVLSASEPALVDALMVSDGQQAWYYEPGRNVVMTGPVDAVEMPLPQEMLSELQEMIQYILDASTVELEGQETVAGRQAYKLVLSPREEDGPQMLPGNGTATLWVDEEQWIVLKAVYDAGSLGRGTMEIQSFELNPGLADDLFAFEVPEGATVVEAEDEEPVPLTLDEARQQAGFPLLVPAYVPRDATLIEVFRSGESIILRYDHSTEVAFALVQGPEPAGPPPLGESRQIQVRGQDATLIADEIGGNTFLYWTENGTTITIAGHIELEEALQVAESLQ